MTTDVNQITSPDWQIKRRAYGEIAEGLDDIGQCIDILCDTEPGSDPLRPGFGVGALQWLDKPYNLAVANIKRTIYDQIGTWEPRAIVTKVSAAAGIGSLDFTIEWETSAGEQGRNEVTYPYAV